MKPLIVVILTSALVALTAGQTIDECLKQDSISCVQKTLYRTAKDFFGKDNLELVGGISLVKSNGVDARSARTSKELAYDQEISTATDIVGRQSVLENFVSDEVGQFLTGRSLRINLGTAVEKVGESARAISQSVPQEIRDAVDEVVEGRGKKKMMKSIMPLLIAAKVKMGLIMTLMYFFIGLMAKKAIIASLISIAISAFIGLKALWSKKTIHHDVTAYNNGWNVPVSSGWAGPSNGGGWAGPVNGGGWTGPVASGGWEDPHAYAHSQAYSGYHH